MRSQKHTKYFQSGPHKSYYLKTNHYSPSSICAYPAMETVVDSTDTHERHTISQNLLAPLIYGGK